MTHARLFAALVLSASLATACATSGSGSSGAMQQQAVNDAEQLGVQALAAKLGIDASFITTGYNLAKSVFASSDHSQAAKQVAAEQGASKVTSAAAAKNIPLTGDQKAGLVTGLAGLLK